MADVKAKQLVQLHDGTNERGVAAAYPVYVGISDGVEVANVNASNQLEVDVKNASIPVTDNGGSITIDDGAGSITVDGSVSITGTVTVAATNLDIRNLAAIQDNVLIYANTVKDGTGTNYVPLVDANGRLQVDIVNGAGGEELVDDAAFTVAVNKVKMAGFIADETTPDVVQEGDGGAARMTLDRKQLVRIVGATDANRLDVDASGYGQFDIAAVSVTAIPISKDSNVNSELNPIFVQVANGASGNEVLNYDTVAALAKDTTSNHDYTVTATKTMLVKRISCAASGAGKYEVQAGPVLSLVTKKVKFGSPSNPNVVFVFDPPLEVPDTSTGTVRIIRKNTDHQAQDMYSTIEGSEV